MHFYVIAILAATITMETQLKSVLLFILATPSLTNVTYTKPTSITNVITF